MRVHGTRGALTAACAALVLATACTAGTTDSPGEKSAEMPTVRIALGGHGEGPARDHFAARGIPDDDIAESKTIVGFLLEQKLIKKSPVLETSLLKGWYEQHAM